MWMIHTIRSSSSVYRWIAYFPLYGSTVRRISTNRTTMEIVLPHFVRNRWDSPMKTISSSVVVRLSTFLPLVGPERPSSGIRPTPGQFPP
mmetsp:Transcript_27053/g.30881  ORF Transcript_27053/g.30881 Transcript_27053/m.30881 type:complete len:90 (+) Transcript_27053:1024-1293(+)